jgi:pyruvate-formate lyase
MSSADTTRRDPETNTDKAQAAPMPATVAFDTTRLDAMKVRVRNGEHKHHRRAGAPDVLKECDAQGLPWMKRVARLVHRMCDAERPVIEPEERIAFTRTTPFVPAIYTREAWAELAAGYTFHELGPISNICANWGVVLSQGLLARRQVALETKARLEGDPEAAMFLDSAIETIDAVLDLARRYAEAAYQAGRKDVGDVFSRVPAHPPRSLREALQALRLLHAVVWMAGHYHVGLGRFDQYLWPYLEADLNSGRLTEAEAEELIAEFFIVLNKDSDLYPGVQQGDNGQSLMLGGVKRDGSDGVNLLTRIGLKAALYTCMIDPKINLRINSKTDLDLLTLAAQLTRKGLGFPQYSNDEVVIPALAAHGYEIEDAREYGVAACWEFLIPGKGMEVVNIGAVSMPAAVDAALRAGLPQRESFDEICARVSVEIQRQVEKVVAAYAKLFVPPAPYYSVLFDGCLERGRDLSEGLKYNNFGVHGAGSANAADALAAVKRFVFDEGSVHGDELLAALDSDFEGFEPLHKKLAEEGPKVGSNNEEADAMLVRLFEYFADACEQIKDNGRGGRVRPGTGTAMYYVWLARGKDGMREPVVGATAEGRKKGGFLSANLSPSLNAPVAGPISILQSYAKIPYDRVFNGGPITMELSDTVFREPESLRKVAMLIRTFAQVGSQQLQLNTLNVETLLDAKKHPEAHKNLIVRVWGWSGYFCELAPEYQDHVINRHIHAMA